MNWFAVATASLFAVALSAQVPPAPGGGEVKPKDKAKVDRRADEMRDNIDHGRQVKSHVRVAARLKNGNKLIGVVKDGRLVERVDGLRFVDAQAREQGAGIRLWYSGGTRNYVFVPFESLQSYEVLQRLSNEQLQELEGQMLIAEQRAAERAAAAAKAATGAATADVPGGAGEVAKPKEGEAAKPAAKPPNEEEQRWAELLKKYPPLLGWNPARRDEIARRFVVVGTKPSEFEQAFVDQFEEWAKACRSTGVDPDTLVEKKPETREERQEERDVRRDERADRAERAERRDTRRNRRRGGEGESSGEGSGGGGN